MGREKHDGRHPLALWERLRRQHSDGAGLSVNHCDDAMCKRVASIRKPTRIFYISDFNPSGDSIPVAGVARQAEYWIKQYAEGTDVKLQPLVLTAEQAQEYALPRTPIKSTDKRKAGFERLHDIGATELDALEALHPGELRNILVEAIEPYRDEDIEQELRVRRERSAGFA